MKKNYVITKIKISSITGRTGKKRADKITKELQDCVFQDVSKDSLAYYLADELAEKGYNIESIKLRKVWSTPLQFLSSPSQPWSFWTLPTQNNERPFYHHNQYNHHLLYYLLYPKSYDLECKKGKDNNLT